MNGSRAETYLDGKTAIITGGFAGIGKTIAIAERGATIAVGARRRPGTAIKELEQASKKLFYHRLDVADIDSVNALSRRWNRPVGQPTYW